jgi:membrane-associated phospholipid phosphatase
VPAVRGRDRSAPRPLLPGRRRAVAGALLAACVAIVAALGVYFAGHTQPGRLDAPIDAAFRSALGGHVSVLEFLSRFGDLPLVTAMTAALVLGCAAARRRRGALLAAIAVPLASGLTEGILKHLVGRTLRGFLSYPSGHATSTFALATVSIILLAAPSPLPAPIRRLLMGGALLFAVAVPSAMVALRFHYFTDIVGGAAVGAGTALLTALLLDTACANGWVRARAVAGSVLSLSRIH